MVQEDMVYFEAVLQSEGGKSIFAEQTFLTTDNLKQFTPAAGNSVHVATILQSLGFRVRHIGTFSISAEGSKELWEKVFGTKVEQKSQPLSTTYPQMKELKYWSHIPGVPFTIPSSLKNLVERA